MQIDFGAACSGLFKTRDKWMTILLLSVCSLLFQHYDLYLERGGRSIAVANEVVRNHNDNLPPLPNRGGRPPDLPQIRTQSP
ncbi:MAG: hypothetical protein WD342_18310 [Verrucomicrobiales bacterium]